MFWIVGSKSFFRKNSRFLADGENTPTSCSHAGIYYDNPKTGQTAPIDARGYLPITKYEYTQVFRGLPAMLAMVKAKDDWFEAFNREKYVPIIAKRLGIKLKDIL